jgi:hypothetical protein
MFGQGSGQSSPDGRVIFYQQDLMRCRDHATANVKVHFGALDRRTEVLQSHEPGNTILS